jgi:hypothetical protein
MALLNLAPDIQEEILFLPLTCRGHDAIKESDVSLLVDTFDWQVQRRRWQQVLQTQKKLRRTGQGWNT